MRLKLILPGLSLLLLSSALAQQANVDGSKSVAAPSLELLEFLADFGEVDAATFDLIEYHARQDQENDENGNSDDKQEIPEDTDEN
jgi:hypothetical protein